MMDLAIPPAEPTPKIAQPAPPHITEAAAPPSQAPVAAEPAPILHIPSAPQGASTGPLVSKVPSKLPEEAKAHFPVGMVVLGLVLFLGGGYFLIRAGHDEPESTKPTAEQPTGIEDLTKNGKPVEAAPAPAAPEPEPAATVSAAAAPPPTPADSRLAPVIAKPVEPKPLSSGTPVKDGDLAGAIAKAAGPTDKADEIAIDKGESARNQNIPQQPPQGSVAAAVGGSLPAAKGCVAGADAVSKATITFGSSGAVKGVSVSGWAAENGKSGCLKSAFQGVNVGAFSKPTYTFSVNVRP